MLRVISSLREFEAVKEDWDLAYAADPHARVFLSWGWLRGYLEKTDQKWCVLAYRRSPSSGDAAFMPLTMPRRRFNLGHNLRLGADLADYAGLVSPPDLLEEALPRFAHFIQNDIYWNSWYLTDTMHPSIPLLLQNFPNTKFLSMETEPTPCPYIPLANCWEDHLSTYVSKGSRKKLRRYAKYFEELDNFQITHVNPDNFEALSATLFKLWLARWGSGPIEIYKNIFRSCLNAGSLWLAVSWVGNTPLAALAGFEDLSKRTIYAFMGSYNEDFMKWSPGRVLDAYCIRYGIENGYQIFDYCRGDSEYKFSLGAQERYTQNFVVKRKTLINKARKIPRGLVHRLSKEKRKMEPASPTF